MSRRKSTGDQEFGSDSFLDIIANIVGILIILIVVAGLRVAQQPAVAESAESLAAAVTQDGPLTNTISADPATASEIEAELLADGPAPAESAVARISEHDPVVIPSPEPSIPQNIEFDEQIRNLSLQLTAATENTATSAAELQQLLVALEQQRGDQQLEQTRRRGILQQKHLLTESITELSQSVAETVEQATAFQSTLTSLNNRQTYISRALKQIGQETQRLSEVLEATEQQQSTADRLHHRLSPVGTSVTEGEVHFRLSGGRIAHIPLDSLLDRLKEQVAARRSVVMRFNRYEGVIGPVGGFHMRYTVERQSVSPLQALQYGQGAYRVSVSRWSILPAETLEAEPVEAALRVGSRMRQIMEATDPDTVITVWLYPDDFQYFSRIREFAHGLNLRVAARPLPDGTPIAGSPNGSRSTSQ